MKQLKRFLILLGVLSCLTPASGATNTNSVAKLVYILPIKDEIERALVYAVRRGVDEAEKNGASAIIIDMNTPGGRVDATMEIMNILATTKAKTYTYVNPHAFSAGAIIAMGTDQIYMATNGLIGDAMPILMSPIPTEGPKDVPDKLHEKITSPVAAMVRSAAQRKGHDPILAEAMVIPPVEDYEIDGKVLAKKGHLLTLTASEAGASVGESNKTILSAGTVNTMDELIEKIGCSGSRRVTIEITSSESLARIIDSFPVSGILLALGLLAIYIEFKTPGFGVFGITGVILLAIWFWGHNIAGVANLGEILLFVLGLSLIVAEVFFFPTMGILGALGTIFMGVAVLMSMIQYAPDTPVFQPPEFQFREAMQNIGVAMLTIFLVGAILAKFLPKTSGFKHLVLSTELKPVEPEPVNKLIGAQGVADSELRPAGIAAIGDKRLDVVTSGEFITKGTAVVVTDVHGSRIVVEALNRKS